MILMSVCWWLPCNYGKWIWTFLSFVHFILKEWILKKKFNSTTRDFDLCWELWRWQITSPSAASRCAYGIHKRIFTRLHHLGVNSIADSEYSISFFPKFNIPVFGYADHEDRPFTVSQLSLQVLTCHLCLINWNPNWLFFCLIIYVGQVLRLYQFILCFSFTITINECSLKWMH